MSQRKRQRQTTGPHQPRSPGRPSDDPAIRERMIEVALSEFSAHGFRGVSVTAIAKQSGATPAMIHYYFGNKQGLYEAVLQHALGPILSRLQSATEYTPDGEDPLPRWSRAAGSREGRPEARHPALRSQS